MSSKLELEKILVEYKDQNLTLQEAMSKITRLLSASGTLHADVKCNCRKPWGVSRDNVPTCIICEKPI